MTVPWWCSPMAPYDLESTGVNVRKDRIVTGYVGLLRPRDPGTPWDVSTQTSVLVNPGVPIHPKATEKHGITDEYAQQHGADPADGVYSIAESISQCLLARIPVVVFNGSFDFSMLHYESLRHGVQTVAERLDVADLASMIDPKRYGPIIDAHVLDKQVDPYRKGSKTLEATAAHYQVKLEGAHDAAFDALAAARIVYRIAKTHPSIGDMDIWDLHAWQVRWRANQAASLQAYFRRTNPQAVVDPCWPLCLDPTHEEA